MKDWEKMSGFFCSIHGGVLIGLVIAGLSFPTMGGFTFQDSFPIDPISSVQEHKKGENLFGIDSLDLSSWVVVPVPEASSVSGQVGSDQVSDFQPVWRQTEAASLFPVIQGGALNTIAGRAYPQDESVNKICQPAGDTSGIHSQPSYFHAIPTTEPATMPVSVSASMIPVPPALVSGAATLVLIGILRTIRRWR
ncbi:MAG: hypothetical protein KatS3mg104_2250 [Phycisphaerae bacterium]|jgi:hypothetical protein|nr:MAG: hypothetical protein KatS3mg104_2250 [Phycisphaerae bacterium]